MDTDAKHVELTEIEETIKANEERLLNLVKRVASLGDDPAFHTDRLHGSVWQHHKGGMYHIDRLVVHSDDPEQVLVVYRPVTRMGGGSKAVYFVRPLDEWLGHMAAEDARGRLVERPRFTPVSGYTMTIGVDVSGNPIALSQPFPD